MDQIATLAALMARQLHEDGVHQTTIPRLSLIRASRPTEPLHVLHRPALCIVTQGRKQVFLGDETYRYGPEQYLLVAVDLPVSGQVVVATPASPYLCLQLDLDPASLSDLVRDLGPGSAPAAPSRAGLVLSPATPELLGAAVRLVDLLFSPRDIGFLAPLAERELLYRLFTGAHGHTMRGIARTDSRLQGVNRAIGWLKEHYREPFSVSELAATARMSPSSLHQHFKAVTSLSPLQYQKRLRLQEARRLIMGTSAKAASAGLSVGYDNPSQFSREYRRLFGLPPRRDAAKLRSSGTPTDVKSS